MGWGEGGEEGAATHEEVKHLLHSKTSVGKGGLADSIQVSHSGTPFSPVLSARPWGEAAMSASCAFCAQS